MKLKINGKEWTINYRKSIAGDRFGDSDHPDEDKPEIRICSKIKEKDMLDTEIHELLHANCSFLDEDVIEATATSIAGFLWRRKYRRKGGEKVRDGKESPSVLDSSNGKFDSSPPPPQEGTNAD